MKSRSIVLLVLLATLVAGTVFAQNPVHRNPSTNETEIYSGPVPQFIRAWSRSLQTGIARLSRRVVDGEWIAALGAFVLAVVFGVVHIAGPGHGKVFAVSYFSARDARLRDGLLYSGIVNVIDSISAFLVVILGYIVLRAALPEFRTEGPRILELVSYGLIALFGVLHLLSHLRSHGHHAAHDRPDHKHGDAHRSEGHNHEAASTSHAPAPAAPVRPGSRPPWMLALSVGLVPCPVSTILLVYGVVNGVLPLMVLMVVGVSAGGFITMSAISSAVILGRSRLLERLRGRTARRVSVSLEFAASGVIIGLGAVMFLAAL